jgi:hypothetical protein
MKKKKNKKDSIKNVPGEVVFKTSKVHHIKLISYFFIFFYYLLLTIIIKVITTIFITINIILL